MSKDELNGLLGEMFNDLLGSFPKMSLGQHRVVGKVSPNFPVGMSFILECVNCSKRHEEHISSEAIRFMREKTSYKEHFDSMEEFFLRDSGPDCTGKPKDRF